MQLTIAREESDLIDRIVERAMKEPAIQKATSAPFLTMDITLVRCNGTELRLDDLVEADDYNFFHDIVGIIMNLDRQTGKVKNFFVPRYAK